MKFKREKERMRIRIRKRKINWKKERKEKKKYRKIKKKIKKIKNNLTPDLDLEIKNKKKNRVKRDNLIRNAINLNKKKRGKVNKMIKKILKEKKIKIKINLYPISIKTNNKINR
jgi:hypothetical protein